MSLASKIKELKNKYGENSIRPLSELSAPKVIPTGVLTLDAYLGGGIPRGRITRLVGEYSGGKSTLALKTAANAQRIDRHSFEPLVYEDGLYINPATGEKGTPCNVLYLDIEQTLDRVWAKALGLTDDAEIITAKSQEEAFDMLNDLLETTELDLVVVDSLAAMPTSKETADSMYDAQVGNNAKTNNRALRVMTGLFGMISQKNLVPPAIILINQYREKVGITYGSPLTTPGGRGQEFFMSVDIELRPQSLAKADKEDDLIVSRETVYTIKKNKITGLYGTGTFKIYVQDAAPYQKGDTDEPSQVLDICVRAGVIEKTGNYFNLGGKKHNGVNAALNFLFSKPELYQEYRVKAFEHVANSYGG